MIIKYLSVVIALLLSVNLIGAPVKSYAGTINGKLKIKMNIRSDKNTISGSYYYESKLINIPLKGVIENNGNISINEFGDSNKKTGVFKGKITGNIIKGTWTTPDGKKTFAFEVKEIAKTADFTGYWSNASDYLSFSLNLAQKGNSITGRHSAVTANASRIDAVIDDEPISITGVISGNVAKIVFKSSYGTDENGNPVKGEAELIYNEETVVWKVTKDANGENFFPEEMILRKK